MTDNASPRQSLLTSTAANNTNQALLIKTEDGPPTLASGLLPKLQNSQGSPSTLLSPLYVAFFICGLE